MKKWVLALFFISVAIFYFTGCSRPAATVNGKKIDKATFESHLKEKMQDHKMQNASPDIKKLRDAVIHELISERLILDEAEKQGIKVSDDELNAQIDAMKKSMGEEALSKALKDKGLTMDSLKKRTREKIVMARFVDSIVKEETVSDEEISDFYKNSPKPFMKPVRILMKMIEISSEADAKAVAAEMQEKKIDFDAMAKKLDEQKRAVVSDYGWVNPDFFSPEIATAARDMQPGQHGGPYKGQKNYFFIKIKDREKESIAKFDDVKNEISAQLLDQKRQTAVAHWIAEKKKTAKIEINIK